MDFVDWSYASQGRNIEEFQVDEAVVAARAATAGTSVSTNRRTEASRAPRPQPQTVSPTWPESP